MLSLANQGEQTISICSNGSNQGCTDILGVAMDGMKLPPLSIFKGTETGCISHKFTVERLGDL